MEDLPLYEPPTHPAALPEPIPDYSPEPAPDEVRLIARRSTQSSLTGVFTNAFGAATLVLLGQEDGAEIPSYGRQGTLKGTIILEKDTSSICQVAVKLHGCLDVSTSDVGTSKTTTVNVVETLWSSENASQSCPDRLEFALTLPKMFKHGDDEHPLPPSYQSRFTGMPFITAQSTYALEIVISKGRRKLGILPNTKRLQQRIEYRPESCPPRPISSTPCSFTSIKTMPEEWYQSSFTMKQRRPQDNLFSHIHCQVFIPAVRIYGRADTIPVHIQLTGALASLRCLVLLGPDSPPPDPTEPQSKSPINIFIMRAVAVHNICKGTTTSRAQRVGTGLVRAAPPIVDFECSCTTNWALPCRGCCDEVVALDWEGEVSLGEQAREAVVGFVAGALNVKDLITIEITPPKAAKTCASPLVPVQHGIPIRFVTQSYVQEDEPVF
ncbi:hypothetical protein MKEN_00382900 [Mycena kentingensis (nom. inval.)]|nr:hypothetical protein MKEN_00382900 [Mycena kentingensis (nom. inval.)]